MDHRMPLDSEDMDDEVMFITPGEMLAMVNVIKKARSLVKADPTKDFLINFKEARLELVQALHLLDQQGTVQ